MQATIVQAPKKFELIKVEFTLESKADLDDFVAIFGKSAFCYPTWKTLIEIQKETK